MFCIRQPFGAVFQQFSGMHTATKTWERQLRSNWLVCAKHLTTPSNREEAAVRVYTLSMPFMATSIITPGMGKIKLLSFAIDEDLCGSVFLVISQRATIHTACSTCVTLSQKQLTRAQHGRSRLGLWMENIKVNGGRQMLHLPYWVRHPGQFQYSTGGHSAGYYNRSSSLHDKQFWTRCPTQLAYTYVCANIQIIWYRLIAHYCIRQWGESY